MCECSNGAHRELAHASHLVGSGDSAVAVFTRYSEARYPVRTATDGTYLAGAHKRLGELHEARGEREKAATYYAKFIELWKDADPPLQPKVAEVRRRLAAIQRAEGR